MAKEIETKNIVLKKVTQDNLEQYLSVKKKASFVAKAYEELDGLWESVEAKLRASVLDDDLCMLICSKEDGEVYGYIGAESDSSESVGIDMGVLEEYRNKGIATEAAKAFVEYVFAELNIDFVRWNAFLSNKAGCRVAEKIGGVKQGVGSTVLEVMQMTGHSVDSQDIDESLQEAQYVIGKTDKKEE